MIVVKMNLHFRERTLEWWSALMLTMWGAYTLLHPGMFESLTPAHGLLMLAPQHVWGFLGFVTGIIRFAALAINGFWYPTPIIRLMTAFMSIFVWFWVEVGMVLSDMPQLGLVVYAGLIAADMYSSFRSASDIYEAEAQRRLKLLAEQTPDLTGGASNVRSIGRH